MTETCNSGSGGVELIKVALVSLGCPKNLVDSEYMVDSMSTAGLIMVTDPAEADVIIVNTCGFIESAKIEAIDTILAMAEYKSQSCRYLVVTGCLAQRYSGDIKTDLPEVDAILGVGAYGEIVQTIRSLYARDSRKIGGTEQENTGENTFEALCEVRRGHTTDHFKTYRTVTTGTFAYLKIAEGCSNKCSYCAIPSIRGGMISRRIEDIVAEAESLLQQNIKELIIVAQDTTAYGLDIYKERKLPQLLQELAALPFEFTIRLLYCYSDGMTDELLELMASEAKICKYIDMPIQHGSDHVLRLMGRKDTRQHIYDVVNKWRKRIPELIFRTTVMVGFPGETATDFAELLTMIKDLQFERLGCFEFSPEEGTKAMTMADVVDSETAKSRYDNVMQIQNSVSEAYNLRRLHTVTSVCIDGITDDGIFYLGRSYAESPDIDPMIYVLATEDNPLQIGDIINVEIIEADAYDITAVTCKNR